MCLYTVAFTSMIALLCTGDSIINDTFTWPALRNGIEQEYHSHLFHRDY